MLYIFSLSLSLSMHFSRQLMGQPDVMAKLQNVMTNPSAMMEVSTKSRYHNEYNNHNENPRMKTQSLTNTFNICFLSCSMLPIQIYRR